MQFQYFKKHHKAEAAFSLPEMIVTIAIVGILAALAMASYSNVNEGAQRTVHQKTLAQLNAALKGYSQSYREIHTARNDAASTDEFLVLHSLQYKPPVSANEFNPGAPYFPPNWTPPASSVTTDWRARWGGYAFELLEPGTAGTGLKLSNDGSGYGTPYAFPSGYQPEK